MSESLANMRFAVVDTETTGLSPATCSMLQLGIVVVRGDGTIESQFSTYIKRRFWKPGRLGAHHIHGITRRKLRKGMTIQEALDRLSIELKTATFVAHNAKFDLDSYGLKHNVADINLLSKNQFAHSRCRDHSIQIKRIHTTCVNLLFAMESLMFRTTTHLLTPLSLHDCCHYCLLKPTSPMRVNWPTLPSNRSAVAL
jgi:hypothetical protein